MGAVPIPLLQRFEAGFAAGARAVNPDAEVLTAYLTQPPDYAGFDDPAKAQGGGARHVRRRARTSSSRRPATSGMGVIDAAHDRGTWAIGVDNDQYLTTDEALRGSILTSMLKNADVGTYAFVRSVAEGTARRAASRSSTWPRGGVGYATSGGFVDADPGRDRRLGAAGSSSGEIIVPSTP